MKFQFAFIAWIALFVPNLVQADADPALLLRNSFVQQYARKAVANGEPAKQAKAEGGCVFDGISQYITVAQWIDAVKVVQAGRSPTFPDAPSDISESIKRCVAYVDARASHS